MKIRDFLSCVTLKFDGWPWKTIGNPFYTTSSFVHRSFRRNQSIETGVTVRKRPIRVKIGNFSSRAVLETKAGPSVRDLQLLVRTRNFLHISLQINVWISQNSDQDQQLFQLSPEHWSRVTLKFDGWPWKTIRHLFYVTSRFVHHFTTNSEFKLELQFRNPQFGSKSAIFVSRVTLKFDGWSKTNQKGTSSFCSHL